MATTSRKIVDAVKNHNFKQSDLVSLDGRGNFILVCNKDAHNGVFDGTVVFDSAGNYPIGHRCYAVSVNDYEIYPYGIMLETEKRG